MIDFRSCGLEHILFSAPATTALNEFFTPFEELVPIKPFRPSTFALTVYLVYIPTGQYVDRAAGLNCRTT